MEEFKSNSHKFREEQKELARKPKMEKVVKRPVKVQKKSEFRKIKDVFISEDLPNVKNYVIFDVLVPTIKKAVSDIITNATDMFLFGTTSKNKSRSSIGHVSYDRFYEKNAVPNRVDTYRAGKIHYNDISFNSRSEAKEVLDALEDMIDRYGMASVGDFFDAVEVTCDYTDYNYGWTSLRGADVVVTRDGFAIKFPKAVPIKK